MHVAGYKYNEIAEKMNLPLGTVKSRIFFARQRLQKMLKDYVDFCFGFFRLIAVITAINNMKRRDLKYIKILERTIGIMKPNDIECWHCGIYGVIQDLSLWQ